VLFLNRITRPKEKHLGNYASLAKTNNSGTKRKTYTKGDYFVFIADGMAGLSFS